MEENQPIEVSFEDGRKEQVIVPTIKLGKYQACYGAHSRGDEFRLLELVCDRPTGWAILLTPASYDSLIAALYGRNQGFFGYAGRQEMMKGVRDMAVNVASRGLNSSRV